MSGDSSIDRSIHVVATSIYLSIYRSVDCSISLSICRPWYLSIYRPIFLSVDRWIDPPVCLYNLEVLFEFPQLGVFDSIGPKAFARGSSANAVAVPCQTQRIAEQGMDIVPGFCFGEKWIHRTVHLPLFLRKVLRKLRMSGTLLKGRGPTFLGFLGVPLGFVWAEPIRVKQQNPVEPAYLDEVHAAVQASVKDILGT